MSGGDEFNNRPFERFLKTWQFTFHPRTTRRASKNGIVERNNGTIKGVLERLQDDNNGLIDVDTIKRAK